MTPERWSRLRQLFHEALERSAPEREAFLAQLADAELRAELAVLLDAHEAGESFLAVAAPRPGGEGTPPNREDGSALLPAGSPVSGRYRVIRLLGRGGHSVVYLAADERIGQRRVVLKVLDGHGDPRLEKRFRQEIEVLGRIHDPAVVAAHDCGELPGGRPFLVMDFVDGITLRERMQRPVGIPETVEIVRKVAAALAAAHRLGIFHRDLKPENIMLERGAEPDTWNVKLIDFGIAKVEQPGGAATTGLFIAGTAQYMAPEQFYGTASEATDVYALAAICCELLTGRTPFAGGAADRLPKSVRPAIRKGLAFDPKERPRDANEFARAVRAALTTGRGARRQAGLALAAVVAALLAGAALFRAPEPPPPRLAPPVRLTDADEFAADPAVSADGRWIAYASDRGSAGRMNIWIREAGSGSTRRLTDDPDGADQPAFSPDGAMLAYHSHSGQGAIYTIPAAGGPAAKLVDAGRRPQYAPDGGTIAYSTGDTESGNATAYVISADGVGATPVNENCGVGGEPVWSFHGRMLMWCKSSAGARQVGDFWSVGGGAAIPTGAAAILAAQGLRPPEGGQNYFSAEAWLGDRLLFAARNDRHSGLWSIHVSDATEKADGAAQFLETPGVSGARGVSVGARKAGGRLLVFSGLQPNVDLWKLRLRSDGSATGLERLTTDRVTDRHASLAADGKSLAFVSDRSGRPSVWWKDLVTGRERQLTTGLDVKLAPRISPDGAQVAFTTEQNHTRTVWIVATAPGAPTAAAVCTKCGYPRAWWTDGIHLLLDPMYDSDRSFGAAVYAARPVISFRDMRTGREALVPSGPYWIEPRISPDGAWVVTGAYATGSPATERVLAIPLAWNADGAPAAAAREQWIQISDRTALNSLPAWGADGSIVYFTSNCDGHTCIWARRLDPKTKQPAGPSFAVYHSHDARLSLENLGPSAGVDLAAGPGELIFAQGERTGSIWMAQVEP